MEKLCCIQNNRTSAFFISLQQNNWNTRDIRRSTSVSQAFETLLVEQLRAGNLFCHLKRFQLTSSNGRKTKRLEAQLTKEMPGVGDQEKISIWITSQQNQTKPQKILFDPAQWLAHVYHFKENKRNSSIWENNLPYWRKMLQTSFWS